MRLSLALSDQPTSDHGKYQGCLKYLLFSIWSSYRGGSSSSILSLTSFHLHLFFTSPPCVAISRFTNFQKKKMIESGNDRISLLFLLIFKYPFTRKQDVLGIDSTTNGFSMRSGCWPHVDLNWACCCCYENIYKIPWHVFNTCVFRAREFGRRGGMIWSVSECWKVLKNEEDVKKTWPCSNFFFSVDKFAVIGQDHLLEGGSPLVENLLL